MATFEELLQQFKQKKLDGSIPMERPADDLGVLSAIQEPAYQQTNEDIAAQKSNEQLLGLPSLNVPYPLDGNVAGINLPQSAPAMSAIEPAQEEAPSVVKSMMNIGSRSKASPQQNTLPPTASAAPVISNDMQQFQDAQALAEKRRMIAGMLKAGSEIGEGMGGLSAGQRLNLPESKTAKYLEESTNNPITDLAAKRKAEKEGLDLMDDRAKNDPKSEVSKLYRDSFKKLGVTVGENATAAALEKAQPAIGAMLNKQMHEESMKLKMQELAQNREIALGAKTSAKQDLNAQRVMSMADKIGATDDSKMLKNTSVAGNVVNAALNEKDDATRRGLLGPAFMLFGKIAQGDTSVVREGDVKMLTTSAGVNADIFDKIKAYASGDKSITDTDLHNMQKVISIVQKQKAEDIAAQYDTIRSRAKMLAPQLTDEEMFSKGTLDLIKQSQKGSPAMAAGEPRKPKTVTQNGHTYTLNEATGKYE